MKKIDVNCTCKDCMYYNNEIGCCFLSTIAIAKDGFCVGFSRKNLMKSLDLVWRDKVIDFIRRRLVCMDSDELDELLFDQSRIILDGKFRRNKEMKDEDMEQHEE